MQEEHAMKRVSLGCLSFFFVLCTFLISVSAQDTPTMINGGVLNGKATSLPKPAYPADAKAAGLEGTVFVDVVIDETGKVISALAATDVRKISKGPGSEPVEVPPADPILREAAEKAALEATFSPTQLSGKPVKISGSIIYNFVAGAASQSDSPSISGGILNGKAVSLPLPEYPAAARAVKAAGAVTVRITIDESGEVVDAAAVSGHPLLRSAAVDAARAAKFAPTVLSGQPVKVTGVLTYNFAP